MPDLALLKQGVAPGQLSDPRFGLGVHDQVRQLPLEGGLDVSDQRWRVVVTPRCAFAEGSVEPGLRIDETALGDQLAGVVVNPVPGERAGPDHRRFRSAVGVDGE